MKLRFLSSFISLFFLVGCVSVELKPIHIIVDVNVKVDKALGDFFGDLDKKSATIQSTPAKP